MRKAIIALLIIAAIVAGWLIILKPNKADAPKVEKTDTSKPVAARQGVQAELTNHSFQFGNFALKYPNDWNLVEGESNADTSQIVTLESPMDAHKFYYCIDFNEYNAMSAVNVDFSVKDVQILEVADLTSEGIGKPLKLVTYQLPSGRIFTTVTDDLQVSSAVKEFMQSITNPAGRKVQIFGRFNCREKTPPPIKLEDYKNSQVYQDGFRVFQNLSF